MSNQTTLGVKEEMSKGYGALGTVLVVGFAIVALVLVYWVVAVVLAVVSIGLFKLIDWGWTKYKTAKLQQAAIESEQFFRERFDQLTQTDRHLKMLFDAVNLKIGTEPGSWVAREPAWPCLDVTPEWHFLKPGEDRGVIWALGQIYYTAELARERFGALIQLRASGGVPRRFKDKNSDDDNDTSSHSLWISPPVTGRRVQL